MSDKVKVRIDRDECILCGACWVDCPDVFEEGPDDGLSQIVLVYQVGGDPASGVYGGWIGTAPASYRFGAPAPGERRLAEKVWGVDKRN